MELKSVFQCLEAFMLYYLFFFFFLFYFNSVNFITFTVVQRSSTLSFTAFPSKHPAHSHLPQPVFVLSFLEWRKDEKQLSTTGLTESQPLPTIKDTCLKSLWGGRGGGMDLIYFWGKEEQTHRGINQMFKSKLVMVLKQF